MTSCYNMFHYEHFVTGGERMKPGGKTEAGASPEDALAGKQLRKDLVLVQLLVSDPRAAASVQLTGGRR